MKAPIRHPAAERLDVRLFGHANVSFAGVPLRFAKRSTTLAMLACVLLERGRPISRESLAYTLFPEVDEAAALAELRRYLYLANKALPAGFAGPWLVADSETVRWEGDGEAFVDVLEFERLSADPQTQERAIELYSGDLLEDVYDDWVLAERERLRSHYLEILNETLDRHRARREFDAAIRCAKRTLAADPWREDTLRALVAIRYESGDTAGALAEYDRFAKRLRDELGVAPMPETAAVRESVLRNEALPGSLEPAAPQTGRGQRPSLVLPFVGRDRELARLRATWTRAARGAGGFVLVSGEAGVGKTRLVSELARIVQAEGGRVFVGTTAAPESAPYQAIVEALRSSLPLLLARPLAPARRSTLSRLLPELRDADASEVNLPEQSAERETSRTYDALSSAVRGLASPRPLLLVLEDLHWAGPATLDALGAIVRDLARAPVVIVGTCREEETPLDHPVRALQRSLSLFSNVEEMQLDRLAENDVADIVAQLEALREEGAALVRELYGQSEGNALFLNEAIGVKLETNQSPAAPAAKSVATVIAARLARLSEAARTVAEVASVAGAGFTVDLIRAVSNGPAAETAQGVDELLDQRILRDAGARASYDLVFTHHLIVDAIYGAIDPTVRARRHARAARFLETTYAENRSASPREIARHYERAGDTERSAAWYLTAARASVAVHAYADAIELAGRALANSRDETVHAEALELREHAYDRRGDRAGQRADIDELERLARGRPRERFAVLKKRVRLARSLGESDEERRLIQELGRVADLLADDDSRAQTLVESATHAGLCSRPAEGLEPARSALAVYERLGELRGQLECLYLLVDFTSNIGDLDASRGYLESMRERARSLADRSMEARALAVAATAALLRQEYRECFELTERGLAINIGINDREGEAASRGRLAAAAVWLLDFATSLREFESALRTYESIGHKRGLATTHANRTMLFMRLGLMRDALVSIERSSSYFEVVQEKRTVVANEVNASFVNLQLGNAGLAKTLAAKALAAAREIGFPVFEAAALANLGNAERALGEIDAAIDHMEHGITIRRRVQDVRDFVDDLADLTLAYASAGRRDDALTTARELKAVGKTGLGGALWPQYICWAMARGFESAGSSEEARAALARARREMHGFAERIEDPQTRAGFLSLPVNLQIARDG